MVASIINLSACEYNKNDYPEYSEVKDENAETQILSNTEGNRVENESAEKDPFIDKSYKLFYGEWEITEIYAEHERLGAQWDAEELIGTKIYMDYEKIEINGKTEVIDPEYRISILPTSIEYYIPYMPTLEELGIQGDYFIHVRVSLEITPPLWGLHFHVKDDNTLYLFYNDACYKVERTKHIPNVEDKYRTY